MGSSSTALRLGPIISSTARLGPIISSGSSRSETSWTRPRCLLIYHLIYSKHTHICSPSLFLHLFNLFCLTPFDMRKLSFPSETFRESPSKHLHNKYLMIHDETKHWGTVGKGSCHIIDFIYLFKPHFTSSTLVTWIDFICLLACLQNYV